MPELNDEQGVKFILVILVRTETEQRRDTLYKHSSKAPLRAEVGGGL